MRYFLDIDEDIWTLDDTLPESDQEFVCLTSSWKSDFRAWGPMTELVRVEVAEEATDIEVDDFDYGPGGTSPTTPPFAPPGSSWYGGGYAAGRYTFTTGSGTSTYTINAANPISPEILARKILEDQRLRLH